MTDTQTPAPILAAAQSDAIETLAEWMAERSPSLYYVPWNRMSDYGKDNWRQTARETVAIYLAAIRAPPRVSDGSGEADETEGLGLKGNSAARRETPVISPDDLDRLECLIPLALRTSRNEALENAAKEAEASPDSHWGPTIATAIRALKEPT